MEWPVVTDQQLREKLLALQTDIVERLQRVHADRQRQSAALTADFAEQAVERENDEVLDQLEISLQTQADDVGTALERLAAGCYGYCRRCGQAISAERLAALPAALDCAVCAD